jgi:excisionase family DNA binding protein
VSERKEVLTTSEAAEYLGVSVWTVRQMAHDNQLPGKKIGRAWRFSRAALLEWLAYPEPRLEARKD